MAYNRTDRIQNTPNRNDEQVQRAQSFTSDFDDYHKKLEKEFRTRIADNRVITAKIDKSIDPSNKEKVKLAQQYFNKYVHQDDILTVDGNWGPETQKAFEEYRTLRKFSTSFSAGTDFKDLERRYFENIEIKKLKVQGTLEIDDAMQEMQEIDAPLFEE